MGFNSGFKGLKQGGCDGLSTQLGSSKYMSVFGMWIFPKVTVLKGDDNMG